MVLSVIVIKAVGKVFKLIILIMPGSQRAKIN